MTAIETYLKDPKFTTDVLEVFTRCRDYLMFRILLVNGQRTGVLDRITPAAIDKARVTHVGAVITVSYTFI